MRPDAPRRAKDIHILQGNQPRFRCHFMAATGCDTGTSPDASAPEDIPEMTTVHVPIESNTHFAPQDLTEHRGRQKAVCCSLF